MRTALAAVTLAFLSTSALAATPDEILAANRAASGGNALTGKAAFTMEFAYVGNGLTGTVAGTADLANGSFEQHFAVGPQSGANGFDGTHVWTKDNSGIVTLQEGGDSVPLAVNNAYRNANLWWQPDRGGAAIAGDGEKTDSGARYDVLTVTPKGGKPFDAWFDAKSHLLYRIAEAQGGVMTTTTTTNYRPFDGIPLAVDTVTSTGNPAYDQHLTLTNASFLKASDASLYVPPKSAAADFAIAGGAHAVTLPFDLIANHIHAHVMVNGKGPYYFIFDTGGVNIVTPALAKALSLKVEGHAEGRGAGEGTMDMSLSHVDKLDVGGAVVNNQLFVAFDLDGMYPANGTHFDGMVGYEVFRRFVTTIDYGNKTITLTDPKFFDPKSAGKAVHIVFNGNAAIVDGSYDGVPGKFQIDTGSRSALTLDAPYVAANHFDAKAPRIVEAVDGWGVGGASRARVMRGGALKIGDAAVIDHPVVGMGTDKAGAFADPTLSGNIGGGVLKRFVVTFDYANNTMYLKPTTGPVTDLDSYDRAGTWFNIDGANYKVISVTKGSPADQAGLKEGDTITAIDGKSPATLDLPSLRQHLRDDAPGTVLTLTIQRDGKPTDLKVTLRDQI
jgi:hypothetical protein